MICTEYILCYLSGTVSSHFVNNIVVVCMDYLYWQVWVSVCLQQLLNNVLMFLVYCTVKCCPPQLCVIVWVSRNGRGLGMGVIKLVQEHM